MRTICMRIERDSIEEERQEKEREKNKGVFLVSAKNAFVPVKCDNSVNTYSRISPVPRGSEQRALRSE